MSASLLPKTSKTTEFPSKARFPAGGSFLICRNCGVRLWRISPAPGRRDACTTNLGHHPAGRCFDRQRFVVRQACGSRPI